MKKLCIVPFTQREFSLLSALSSMFEITALVAPRGIGKDGEDISVLRNIQPVELSFCNSIENGLNSANVILISDIAPTKKALYAFAVAALHLAIKANKEILCYLELSKEEKEEILSECIKNDVKVWFLSPQKNIHLEMEERIQFSEISAPIFIVSELIPESEGYDVFLKIAQWFKEHNKSVLAVSEDRYNLLFGYQYITFFSEINVHKQALAINQLVSRLEQEKRPDVILIRLPYPMISYDSKHLFDCGTSAYLISQALPCSGCILCSPTKCVQPSAWVKIYETIKARFGLPVLGTHISNQFLDLSGDLNLSLLHLPYNEVKTEVEMLNATEGDNFYRLLENSEMDRLCRRLEKEYIDLLYGVI